MSKVVKTVLILICCITLNATSTYACIPHINNIKVKSIYGKVSFAEGKNQVHTNAKVEVLKQYNEKDQDGEFETKYIKIAETTTDKNGYFRFSNLQKGKYAIVVKTKNFNRFWHILKLTRSNYEKKLKKELVVYLGTPTRCNEVLEVHKIRNNQTS